jgi:VWFA-related protein
MTRNFLIAALVCQLALSGFAQQPGPQRQKAKPQSEPQQAAPPSDDEVVKITTNLVQVDPVITDKNGKIVTDLSADEVEILEDGKPQKITNFAFVPLESGEQPLVARKTPDKDSPPVPAVRLRPEDVRRTIAIVVDDLGLSFESVAFVRNAVKKFLDQQMEPGDLVAIIRTGGGIGALQQFTSDKRQLYAALERVRFNPTSRAAGAFASATPDPLAVAGTAMSEANGPDQERRDDIDQLREDLFAIGTLGAVNYVIRGLKDLPGRKSVVLISNGITLFRSDNQAQNYRVENALLRLTDLANRSSVVIYSIDARGLETLNFTAADAHINPVELGGVLSGRHGDNFDSQGGLRQLAEATGGFAIVNSNDLSGGIRKALDDQKGYYLIGYRPADSTFDTVGGKRPFHRISVRVKRPGKFTVRMRKGFFGVTQEEGIQEAAKTPRDLLLTALTSPFGSAGVNLRLTSLYFDDSKLGSTMRSLLYIKASDLTFAEQPDGWHQSVIDLIAMTFGDNGIVVDQLSHTHTLRLRGKAYENALKHGVTYSINVPIKKPGAYQFRTALRDVVSNRVGSASQFVEVPNISKKRLTLSGIVSRGIDPGAYERTAAAANDNNSDQELEGADPLSNAALRQFKPGLVVEYGLAIYNAQLDKATGKPQLLTQVKLFRNGQSVFVGKEVAVDAGKQLDLKRLTTNGAVQLGSQMEPGEYVLQLVVTDLLRKDKHRVASQWTDFEVVR